jgi:hypothetical protein
LVNALVATPASRYAAASYIIASLICHMRSL